MTAKQWVTRERIGRGFRYHAGDAPITDKAQLAYYASLHIPPAWKDVRIAFSTRSRILATGTDKAGRTQYVYHPTFRARQEKSKFERTLRFARALPAMRRITRTHLQHATLDREKVLACVVQLIDQAYFRVGNEEYAKENHTYGITTLRSKHTEVHAAPLFLILPARAASTIVTYYHRTLAKRREAARRTPWLRNL